MAMSSRARWLWLLAALSAGTTRGDVRQVILPAATTVSSPAGARAGFSASCGTRSLDSHVYPYVRVVRIDERTHTLIHEPDITSSERAWQLPAVAIDARGNLGGVLVGGGSSFPTVAGLIVRPAQPTPVTPRGVASRLRRPATLR
jgi:hypothetical protein